jgi:hypothetical protein
VVASAFDWVLFPVIMKGFNKDEQSTDKDEEHTHDGAAHALHY